jgi:hypothetical protein
MSHLGHLYRKGTRGRSLQSAAGVGGTTFVAHVACSRCPVIGERRLRELMPPEQIDRKFIQAGWALDPHRCPTCRMAAAKEKTMASKPTPAAMKAQANMFALLTTHFDGDAGAYAPGWSDAKVASDTSLAVEHVTEFRRVAFGELKEPSEIRALRDDIKALDQLAKEQATGITSEIASLRSRLAEISKRWAA